MLLGTLAATAPTTAAQAGPTLQVVAPAQVRVGEPIRVTLAVQDGADIAGFEAQLLFDPTAAEYAGLREPGADLQRAGRDTRPLVAPELPNGAAVALVSCPQAACGVSSGPALAGARGTVRLATVELVPTRPGTVEIKVAAPRVVNAAGEAVAVNLPVTSVAVQVGAAAQGPFHAAPAPRWALAEPAALRPAAGPFDLTGDGQVTHADLMEVALEWQITHERGSVCGPFDRSRDVNHDGCLDVADLQLVAARLQPPRAAPQGAAGAQSTFTVNSTGDQSDSNAGNGTCATSSATCTLRAAIQEANARMGADTILFNIPGSGVQTIQLGSRLPTLSDQTGGTTIDGYSQPGSAPNTAALASNATLRVQVAGTGEENFDGLPITSANNVVRGLAIHKVTRAFWIYGNAASDNRLAGLFIGTNAAGTYGAPEQSTLQAHGVHIEQGAKRNQVGTAALADRNVISGNGRHGVGLWHNGTDSNVVVNNIVGLNPAGTARLANRKHGLDVNYGGAYNRFGGTGANERNVVSGNDGTGAEASHTEETEQNLIVGNFVGTDLTGTTAPSYAYNRFNGIALKDRATGNTVSDNVVANSREGGIEVDDYDACCQGVNVITNNRIGVGANGSALGNSLFGVRILSPNTQVGPGNLIAYNPVGIQIERSDSDGNRITGNSIWGNTGLGIDLNPIGSVNLNDAGDGDTGPNEQLNFPVLTSATSQSVAGTACAGCTVEVFSADGGSGAYGEGQTLLASTVAAGDGTFAASVSGLAVGSYVTATATDGAGNTSEFALNFIVANPIPLPGRIEAENYRGGGQNVGYYDTTTGNSGGVYRSDDVDIQATQDTGGGYNIGWVVANEWLSYDVTVAASDTYRFRVRVATTSTGRKVRIEVDGVNVTGSLTAPNTGGFQTWATVTSAPVFLAAGSHTVRLVLETSSVNVNYVEVVAD